MNVVTIDGNLTQDPSELREGKGKSGMFKARSFRIAHKIAKDKALFVNVEVFNGWAENLRAKKGDAVVIVGELVENSFVGKDGKTRSNLYVRAREVKLLARKPKAGPSAESDEENSSA